LPPRSAAAFVDTPSPFFPRGSAAQERPDACGADRGVAGGRQRRGARRVCGAPARPHRAGHARQAAARRLPHAGWVADGMCAAWQFGRRGCWLLGPSVASCRTLDLKAAGCSSWV
jgi:hypothetical protein